MTHVNIATQHCIAGHPGTAKLDHLFVVLMVIEVGDFIIFIYSYKIITPSARWTLEYLVEFTGPTGLIENLHHQTVALQIQRRLKAYMALLVEERFARRPIDLQVEHVPRGQHNALHTNVVLARGTISWRG